MLTREQIEKIQQDGAKAFAAGQKSADCPYPMHHPAFPTWTRGYQNAAFGAALSRSSNP